MSSIFGTFRWCRQNIPVQAQVHCDHLNLSQYCFWCIREIQYKWQMVNCLRLAWHIFNLSLDSLQCTCSTIEMDCIRKRINGKVTILQVPRICNMKNYKGVPEVGLPSSSPNCRSIVTHYSLVCNFSFRAVIPGEWQMDEHWENDETCNMKHLIAQGLSFLFQHLNEFASWDRIEKLEHRVWPTE